MTNMCDWWGNREWGFGKAQIPWNALQRLACIAFSSKQ